MKSCGKNDKISPGRTIILPGEVASGAVVGIGLAEVFQDSLARDSELSAHTDAFNFSGADEVIGAVDADSQDPGQLFDGDDIGTRHDFFLLNNTDLLAFEYKLQTICTKI